MTQSARNLLDRAVFCRRLANAIAHRANPIAGALRELADQYQEQALANKDLVDTGNRSGTISNF